MVQVTHNPNDEDNFSSSYSSNTFSDYEAVLPLNVANVELVDEAYRRVTSAMMANPLYTTDSTVALNLLESSLINRNIPLAKHYIENLKEVIKKEDCIKILNTLGRFIHSSGAERYFCLEPSAPPLVDNQEERNDCWMKEPLLTVRDKVLLEIDKDGDYFLQMEDFINLYHEDVLAIMDRDTLNVSSELLVYSAIMRWAEKECERRDLNPEDDNKKKVLIGLIYSPRYGLMSKEEFSMRNVDGHRGPDRIGLPRVLNEQILDYICSKSKKKPAKELPYNLSKNRIKINLPVENLIIDSSSSSPSSKTPTKEKVIINCLTCFSALFD